MKCEICGREVDIDKGRPSYISVGGWQGDCQYTLDVCIKCFVDRSAEILGKLCKGKYE